MNEGRTGLRVAIGSDHAGVTYKSALIEFMRGLGHEVRDFGTNTEEAVDYPDFIRPVAEAVARGEYDRGVVLGGSGNGEAMVANKIRGVRCALCWDTTTARLGREHNDANVVSMGQRVIGIQTAKDIVQVFLTAEFQAGRHVRRLEKMES
jgi:ribose 5-phosphate isomerase B